METPLTLAEVRVLGCLIEKELTTPEYYPLTLNSLVTACNQKTNRDPVVEFDEDTVASAIEGLRERRLALRVDQAGGRVPKFKHYAAERFGLARPDLAVLCLLLVRGPQTAGELRGRAERAHAFGTVAEVEEVLAELAGLGEPLARALPLSPGRKEVRWTHLLAGEPAAEAAAAPASAAVPLSPVVADVAALKEAQAALRAEVEGLRAEVARLGQDLARLRAELG